MIATEVQCAILIVDLSSKIDIKTSLIVLLVLDPPLLSFLCLFLDELNIFMILFQGIKLLLFDLTVELQLIDHDIIGIL